MNSTVAAVVSGVVADMIEVSTLDGQVLGSGVALSLLQVDTQECCSGRSHSPHPPSVGKIFLRNAQIYLAF